ncbi:hypothetical protein G4177_33415 [Corallococcus sp. ZKHCc1 1396]|uniref:PPM-type phosphatase domain-containing protein n=1 Tax=Corallococcus soli TaxID=2710757 RepID=A0ABR9PYQ7_9BACT|nr:hypothetical protein [Corallococcus soli]MBE4753062.1 hypothetical protein [Corallococcus soli]
MADAHGAVLRGQRAFGQMGLTTLAFLLVVGGRALLAHVGDSRVYRLRAGHLEQLTQDHSDSRHVLNRCLGSPRAGSDATPDVLETDLQPGDVYLLSWTSKPVVSDADVETRAKVLRRPPSLKRRGPRG